MNGGQKFSTFYLDDFLFGIEVEKIQEVLGYQDITPVPLAPPMVLGLINLRGQIITAMSLRRRLGLGERNESEHSAINIVVRSKKDAVSLLVDSVGEVLELGSDTFELPPDTMESQSRELIRGVHKLKDKLMHVVDTDRAIELIGSIKE